jgi:formylglycine-generating enzyme required for sulfatase activity
MKSGQANRRIWTAAAWLAALAGCAWRAWGAELSREEKEAGEDYYAECYAANGQLLPGEELKAVLGRILQEKAGPGVRRGRIDRILRVTDACPTNAGMVQCVYSRQGTTNATKEHVWPVSHGAHGAAQSDLHNVRAADRWMNEARGRRDFDDCRGLEGAKEMNGCWMTWSAWEPPDEVKGDMARAAMYMAVRYGEGENGLELVDATWTGKRQLGRLSTLLEWNERDPVDNGERQRNELVFEHYQGNRNPFVDHPEWARVVFGGESLAASPAKKGMDAREVEPQETPALVVEGLEARQRYPWNGLVDIDYTVATEEEGAGVAVAVRGVDRETGEEVEMRSLEGDGAAGPVTAGTRRLTWNLGADAPELVSDSFSVELSAWLAGGQYLVVDMVGGREAESWPVSRLDEIPEGGWTEDFKTTKLVLRRIPAGTFAMGSPEGECGRWADEGLHEVVLSTPYYLGVFEVTQRQWELAMGSHPSYYEGATRPVDLASYEMIRGASLGAGWPASRAVDRESFFGVLREKTGLAFDLPTEAQWEHACRAGTETALNNGENLTGNRTCTNLSALGRYCYNGGMCPSIDAHTAVGGYQPNAWGLYDMHGNVWEWCLDWYGPYGSGAATDPVGAQEGTTRVCRGGGWYGWAGACRSAGRHDRVPSYERCGGGFRVACAAGTDGASGWVGSAAWTETVALSGWLGAEWEDWEDGGATWEVVAGPGEIRDGELAFTGMGEVVVAGTLPGNSGILPCNVARTVTVGKATAKVVLDGVTVQEAGRVEGWSVRTEPEGLEVELRYDGQSELPTETGWHTVEASVDDARYKGQATGTLVLVEPGRYMAVDLSEGMEAESWPVEMLDGMPAGGWAEECKTSKLLLRWVDPGTFTMGSPETEIGRSENETPHEVTLSQGYWMGVFEVTRRQMELAVGKTNKFADREAMPANPSYDNLRGAVAGGGWPGNHEVDADSLLGQLRTKTGLLFDLPTEAEWEYACRAGTRTALNNGQNLVGTWREPCMEEAGRYRYNSGFSGASDGRGIENGTAAAGSYLPNAWGLYDMHGNVLEWCRDWYGAYPADAVTDPAGAETGRARVLRGGSLCCEAAASRSAWRTRMSSVGWSWETGGRVACYGPLPVGGLSGAK